MKNDLIEVELIDEVATTPVVLGFCLSRCPVGSLVVRHGHSAVNPLISQFINRLKPWLVNQAEVHEWPGTVLLDGRATLFTFKLTERSPALLEECAYYLFEFVSPELPEDLCLYRDNGSALLISIAHEGDAYMQLTPAEAEEWGKYLDQQGTLGL